MKHTTSENVLYPELSYQIMQAVYEVHNKLGPGFTEDIYEEATIIELEALGLEVARQKPIEIIYKGKVVGKFRIDLIVEGKVILELKAVTALNDVFKQQLLSYLKATDLRLGILINFGSRRVESVRIVN